MGGVGLEVLVGVKRGGLRLGVSSGGRWSGVWDDGVRKKLEKERNREGQTAKDNSMLRRLMGGFGYGGIRVVVTLRLSSKRLATAFGNKALLSSFDQEARR